MNCVAAWMPTSTKDYVLVLSQPYSMTKIRNLKLSFPEKTLEQARIATILSDMDTEIATMETKLAKYQQIKQGMMQNLLTGRIRLT